MTQQEFQKIYGGEIIDGRLVFKGNLYCYNNQLTSLPEGLKVEGNLYCYNNQLTSLPKGLEVEGSLYCSDNQLTSLPEGLKVEGNLYCSYNKLTSLFKGLKVGGNLDCSDNQLTSLPKGLKIEGDLDCSKNQLTSLPKGLEVGGNLDCSYNKLTSLPEGLEVEGSLYCSDNKLTSLFKGLKVGGNLYCYNNPNLSPHNIKVKVKKIAFYSQHLISYELFDKLRNNQITAKEILKLENIEERMVALSVYNPSKLLKEFKAKKIDTNNRGDELYEIDKDIFGLDENVKIGKYYDWSTNRIYIDFMHPECQTIDEALAKRHHFTLEEWSKVQHA